MLFEKYVEVINDGTFSHQLICMEFYDGDRKNIFTTASRFQFSLNDEYHQASAEVKIYNEIFYRRFMDE